MIMSIRTRVACFLLAAGVVSSPMMAAEHATLLPAYTIIYLHWPGAQTLESTCRDTAFGKLMAEPEMKRFSEAIETRVWPAIKTKMREDAPEDEAAMIEPVLTAIDAAWTNAVTIALLNVGMNEAGPQVNAVAIMRDGGEAMTALSEAILASIPEDEADDLTLSDVTVGGEPFKQLVLTEGPGLLLQWGVRGDDAFIIMGESYATFLETDGPTLADSEAFKTAMAEVQGDDSTPSAFLNFKAVVANLEKFQTLFAAMQLPVLGEEGGVQGLLEATGMGNLQSFSMAMAPEGDTFKTTTFLHAPGLGENASAMWKQAAITDDDLRVVPKDASWASVTNFDLAVAYDGLLKSIELVTPEMYEGLIGALGMIQGQFGVNVRDDFLAAFGDTWAIFDAPSNGGALWLTGITLVAEVKSPDTMQQTIEAITGLIAGFAAQAAENPNAVSLGQDTYRDHTIHFMKFAGLPIPVAPAWAQHGEHWVLAIYPQMVRVTLDRLIDKSESILDNADFQRGMAMLPKGPTQIAYVDNVAGMRDVYALGLPIAQMLITMGAGEGIPVDATILPSLTPLQKHMFGTLSAAYLTPNGSKTIMQGPSPMPIPAMGASASVAGVGMMTAILLPSLARARHLAKRSVSASNLRSIAMLCHVYALENEEQYPPDLDTLVESGDLSPKSLIAPLQPAWQEGTSYIYVKGLTAAAPSDLILVYEDPTIDDEGTNVAFIDGHVDFLYPEQFEEALERTETYLEEK